MTPQHYHVHAGFVGCLPSYSATWPTCDEALADMVAYKRRAEDDVGCKLFTGTAQFHRRYDAIDTAKAGVDYVELVPCQDLICSAACDECDQNCIVVDNVGSCGLQPTVPLSVI